MYKKSGESRLRQLERYRKRRRKKRIKRFVRAVIILLLLSLLALAVVKGIKAANRHGGTSALASSKKLNAKTLTAPEWVDVQLIPAGNARLGIKLDSISDIVIHYTGNPQTTAQNNRDYFAKPDTEVCSHFVIDSDGTVIQCVPLDEKSAASNQRNRDTISIEVCHPDKSGVFTEAAYNSLVRLTAWLCNNSDLTEENVIRHYDVTGKECPLYYVKNPDKWKSFKRDVKNSMGS